MAKAKLITIGDTLNIHAEADGTMLCSLCGRYRNGFQTEVWADVDGVVRDWRDDEDPAVMVLPVCESCSDKFTDEALCRM